MGGERQGGSGFRPKQHPGAVPEVERYERDKSATKGGQPYGDVTIMTTKLKMWKTLNLNQRLFKTAAP